MISCDKCGNRANYECLNDICNSTLCETCISDNYEYDDWGNVKNGKCPFCDNTDLNENI